GERSLPKAKSIAYREHERTDGMQAALPPNHHIGHLASFTGRKRDHLGKYAGQDESAWPVLGQAHPGKGERAPILQLDVNLNRTPEEHALPTATDGAERPSSRTHPERDYKQEHAERRGHEEERRAGERRRHHEQERDQRLHPPARPATVSASSIGTGT